MMKISPILPLLLLVSFAMLHTGCGKKTEPPPAVSALTKVRFQTDWFPEPEHGGYYQALAKGFYAAEGLEVEILPGGPSAGVMAAVATGRASLGMTNGDDVIVAIARGVPIKMVAAEMQRDPQGILYHEEHPLRSMRDLDGKTIMAGVGSVWLQYIQKHHCIKVNILPLVGDLARFMNDKHFIQQCFVTNEPYFARQRGAKAGALLIATEGAYEPYRVMFASNDFIAKNPEVARRFVRASIKGWSDYIQGDPKPANDLLLKLRSDLTPDFLAYSLKAMRDYQLVLGDPKRDERAGQLTPQRLQHQIDLLRDIGVLDQPVKLEEVVTLEFMPDEVFPGGQRAR